LLKEKVTNASFVNIIALGLWRTIKSSIRFDALKEKQEALKKKKENTYKKKEKQTSDIVYYGLWQSCTAVDEILRSITKQTEKRKAHCPTHYHI
jgi:argininosuccinate synthase